MAQQLIRVAVVDDHPAMRAGVGSVLATVPDVELAGEAASGGELAPLLQRTAPDVVLLDYHLPGDDGLLICHRLKRRVPSPAVILYSAWAGAWLAAPARLARADAVLSKHAPATQLLGTLREVVRDGPQLPELEPEQHASLNAILPPEDVGLAGMLMLDVPYGEIAKRSGLDAPALSARVEDLLRRVTAAYGPGLPAHAPEAR